ncbi:thioredoxin [Odoribacter splanchnicus]|nr:thioredoxin [Odoribacter splanchnicus]RGV28022.1 thioredoxin [Odoribacter splanchnicus]RGY04618.1 thioredoxin [Odoribacter splanchnicus]RHA77357.1 thioredoxin [Odoribacter splanchnicus]RHL84859.1 thioredoxin [Odoribacter splanchnicus]
MKTKYRKIETFQEAGKYILKIKRVFMENLWALIKGNLPVFVMFYASWCPHCRKMLPIVRKLENNKHLNLQCFDIDDPANRRLVDYYQVQAVPLMMIYKAGEQLWRWNGEIEEEELMQTLKRLLK